MTTAGETIPLIRAQITRLHSRTVQYLAPTPVKFDDLKVQEIHDIRDCPSFRMEMPRRNTRVFAVSDVKFCTPKTSVRTATTPTVKFVACAMIGYVCAVAGCSAEGVEIVPSGWDRDAMVTNGVIDPTAKFSEANEPTSTENSAIIQPESSKRLQSVLSEEPEITEQQAPDPPCPDDMVHVHGTHCLEVTQRCLEHIEDPRQNPFARCRRFEEPTVCKGERVKMSFCIDRFEMAGEDGLPLADKSFTDAKQLCEQLGKRLCAEREWLFACEGEEARPYPYGFERTPGICNLDITEDLVTNKGLLADHRQPVTANPQCVSPFGVQNMVGNIDEWIVLEKPHWSTKIRGKKMISGLKGGWWGPLRNRCRPTTVDHDEIYHELQTGVRCCKNAANED